MASKRGYLVITLEAAGNWPPERALIRELAARGHEVRVVSNENHAADIRAAGAMYEPYLHAPQRDPVRRADDPANEMLRVLHEVFFNPIYADELLTAVARHRPDVLLVDQMLVMAAIGAESTGLPTAILWHTVYVAMAGMRAMASQFVEPKNALRARLGLAPEMDRSEVAERAGAILAFTYAQFDADHPDPPAQLHYVGPLACLPQAHAGYALPWPANDRRPLVLVSYSTSFQNQVDTLQRVVKAVADIDARVLLTLGHAIAASELRLPVNVVTEQFVPHAAVLPHAQLVVTHAGHGTVMAAVTAGVPLVCTPMGRDQHGVAACVERCGLGHVVSMTASADELHNVISGALNDHRLQERARAFAADLDLQSGLQRALAVVEQL